MMMMMIMIMMSRFNDASIHEDNLCQNDILTLLGIERAKRMSYN